MEYSINTGKTDKKESNLKEENINIDNLPYRHGVIAFVVTKNNEFILIQNEDYRKNEWGFPGGGIEKDELPQQAMLRELEEELGTNKFKILGQSQNDLKYDFPIDFVINSLKNRPKNKHNKGQVKIPFLVKFEGDKSDIKIREGEIKNYKFVEYKELPKYLIFPNQFEDSKTVIEEFKEKGLLQT